MDFELAQRAACTLDEKQQCIPIIKELFDISSEARTYGVLIFEEMLDEREFLLKKGMSYLLDGIDPEMVRKILYNYIYSSNATGVQLLRQILIAEGLLLIQEGCNPHLLVDVLFSYLGEEANADAMLSYDAMKVESASQQQMIGEYITSVRDREAVVEESNLFQHICNLNARWIQKIIRRCGLPLIAEAISCSSGNTQIRCIENINSRNAALLVEHLSGYKRLTERLKRNCLQAQEKVCVIACDLEKHGEIVLVDNNKTPGQLNQP